MWNVGYYAHIFQSDHQFVSTSSETDFFPTVEQAREAMRGARMMMINSPLNPTGTAISEDVLRGIAQALVEENRGRERPCMLVYDQVYWMLTAEGTKHLNPVALVPECAPYVVQVDAISKCFAATGLRVGWGVLPSYLQPKMKALVGHMGSWAPRPEQLATAWFLSDPDRVAASMTEMRSQISARLNRLYQGISDMRDRGLPVDAIAPQGAIYLSLRVNLVGRGFENNEAVRRHLLHEAGVAVVPFQAFDLPEDTGWFRMSVGAVGLDQIDVALGRMEAVIGAV
jgi:aspartate aminotransferase